MSHIARRRFALILVPALLVPAAAQAEGFFGALMNLFGGGRPAQQEPAPPPPQPMPSASNPLEFPGLNTQPVPPSRGGPQVAFCVRTCDGRYFPMPRNAGGANSTPAKICSAMCPTAETKIFSGSNIENAAASDGSRYAGLKNAFLYREKLIEGCSCNGGDGAGNTAINISADPTLRPGDIVVTGNGPMMFKGGKASSHQRSDFTPATEDARMSAKLRDKVTAIKVARPGNAPVAGVIRQAEPTPVNPAEAEPSPVETAAQVFNFKDFDAAALRGTAAMGYTGQQ